MKKISGFAGDLERKPTYKKDTANPGQSPEVLGFSRPLTPEFLDQANARSEHREREEISFELDKALEAFSVELSEEDPGYARVVVSAIESANREAGLLGVKSVLETIVEKQLAFPPQVRNLCSKFLDVVRHYESQAKKS